MHCCIVFVLLITGQNERPLLPFYFAEQIVSQWFLKYACFQIEPFENSHIKECVRILEDCCTINCKSCATGCVCAMAQSWDNDSEESVSHWTMGCSLSLDNHSSLSSVAQGVSGGSLSLWAAKCCMTVWSVCGSILEFVLHKCDVIITCKGAGYLAAYRADINWDVKSHWLSLLPSSV